ncbi:MarR family transcriptional regulator, partial [Blautia hydrogenotrophica]
MRKEEWMVMIENMQKLHYFSRNMLLQNQRLTLRTAEMELMLLIYLKLGELTPLDVSQIMGMRKESVSRTLKSLLSKGY